jgi:hypothetical protein
MILKIINQLAAMTSRKEKEYILKEHKDNELLKTVFWATYNPDLTYWIQKTPAYTNTAVAMSLKTAIEKLQAQIATRAVTGNAAVNFYQALLSSLSADDAEVLRRIVIRDLRCGVNIPTINKIWKGLIPTYELMLAESDPKRLVFPCYVQKKFDGLRCLITRTLNDEIILRTRNGNPITSLSVMESYLKEVVQRGETWDGELVCYANGKPLPRKVSNGILNKAIRETILPSEAALVTFQCWDIVDQTQKITYENRLDTLYSRFVSKRNAKVFPVETETVRTIGEVEALFEKALKVGEEGVIAKNKDAVWQPKRTFDLVKFKAEKTVDLLVVGWEEGTGKNVGRMGALVCETSDSLVRVNVGTGYSDAQRIEFMQNKPIDRIVEVMYNARITKKGGGVDSLYLPRFIKIREDKSEANSSKEVK